MSHSLVAKLSGLKHKGFITEAEYDRLRKGLNSLKVDEMYQLEKEDADEFIPKSVIEDIKAEIRSIQPKWHENAGKHNCIDEVIKIIDRNISRKEPVGNADKLDNHINGKETE